MPLWWFSIAPPLYFLVLFAIPALFAIYAMGFREWRAKQVWRLQVPLAISGTALVMTWEILVNYFRSH